MDAILTLYRVIPIPIFGYYYQSVASADPAISATAPFSGLGASFSLSLQPGTYGIQVRSHGNYGDVGGYTLSVWQPSILVLESLTIAQVSTIAKATIVTTSDLNNPPFQTTKASAGAGQFVASNPSIATPDLKVTKTAKAFNKLAAVDELFGHWPELNLLPRLIS